ncbi:DUF222 domain-containing protein [Arthrobacter sp. 3Tela_A]|uniref:HNH endonuclease n=1 Tax=Arthrobacter sp. 3Tela_A TaxID=3093743 RepID=UPI003BB4CE26
MDTVRSFAAALADADPSETTDSKLIDLMRVLEELKSAAAAVQARAAAVFDASQRRAQSRAGVPAEHLGRGIGAQVALARRDSPHRGSRHLGFGKALVHEMPHTLAALSSGVLSEWRATLIVRETACLDLEDRHRVDELICADPSSLEGLGDRKLIARIRSITQTIDPASQVRRNAKAVSERYVSCRPAPDTMSYLTGLLPVAQGVAVYAALSRAADSLRAAGDERGRGQIMADTLVERVTGQTAADRIPVEVQLVITDRTLLAGVVAPRGRIARGWGDQGWGDQDGVPGMPAARTAAQSDKPAYFPGYGIVPGAWARELIRSALGAGDRRAAPPPPAGRQSPSGAGLFTEPPPGAAASSEPPTDNARFPDPEPAGLVAPPAELSLVSLRRLYLDPVSGELTAMESKARTFPAGLARMIRTRDQTCRTPWCDAPIRHIDHIQPHAEGGPTSYTNGQGLCEACNHAKEAPGWNATTIRTTPPGNGSASTPTPARPTVARPTPRTDPVSRHKVRITTPTGHTYTSTAPPLPGARLQETGIKGTRP